MDTPLRRASDDLPNLGIIANETRVEKITTDLKKIWGKML